MAKAALLTLALLLAACGGRRLSEGPIETAAPISPDCPFGSEPRADASERQRVFDAAFGFVSAVYAREAARGAATPEQMRTLAREARSYLTPAYDARLPRLEDAHTPIHNGEGVRDFGADYLRTRFERGTATQEIAYCFAGGGIWTQVFHLRRIDGGWKVDSIEPSRRRQA